jgi:hypothetical protein
MIFPFSDRSVLPLIFTTHTFISGGPERLHEISKSGKRTYQCLPDLRHNPGQNKNSKKALKVLKSNRITTL